MVAKAADYKIIEKKNKRFSVRKRGGGFVNGADKVKVLVDAGKIKAPVPKKVEEPVEAPAEEAAAE